MHLDYRFLVWYACRTKVRLRERRERDMADEKAMEALRIFRTLEEQEKIKYLSRLRALAGKQVPAPAPPPKAP